MSKVGILGGSFDPIHEGHIFIAKTAMKKLKLDKILLIPTVLSPFKKDRPPISFEDRFQMCKLACASLENFEVSSIENELSSPSYTIQTIRALKEKCDDEFYFIIGSDQSCQLKDWKEIDELVKLVNFVVIARDTNEIICEYPHIAIQTNLHPASSSEIRRGNFMYLHENVRNYIFEKELYLKDIVHSRMSDRRFAHTLSVRKLSKELAKIHGLDEHKASLAALLHDIAKEFDSKTMNRYMRLESKEHQSQPSAIHHQYVGALFVKNVLRLNDEDVISAIYNHTTGGVDNPYVHILFIADKIEPTRGYDATEELNLAKIDLKTAYDFVARKQKEYIKKGN